MSEEIRRMFGSVAHRYDRANQFLSWGIHHRWRRRTVELAQVQRGMTVLDCATGTGDLALAFKWAVGSSGVVSGIDFCAPMIDLAVPKAQRSGLDIEYVVGDILKLPYVDDTFDVSSIAFGIRNVDDPAAGLAEMARVVRPGGRVVVLEFGQPDGAIVGPLYRWYSRRIIPAVGGWLSGRPSSYEYLTRTSADFPAGQAFEDLMNGTEAFGVINTVPLSSRIAYVYVGVVA